MAELDELECWQRVPSTDPDLGTRDCFCAVLAAKSASRTRAGGQSDAAPKSVEIAGGTERPVSTSVWSRQARVRSARSRTSSAYGAMAGVALAISVVVL